MSKAVLLSMNPDWCGWITAGAKTIEVRKNKPKIEVPFKVYVYCTKANGWGFYIKTHNADVAYLANSKVIGEFICGRIDKYESEFCNNDCYEDIRRIFLDEDGEEDFEKIWDNEDDNYENFVFPHSCVSYQELKNYIGIGIKTFYAWHISNLIIYDKPKDLSEFRHYHKSCEGCKRLDKSPLPYCDKNNYLLSSTCVNIITKPPQSFYYVEELE